MAGTITNIRIGAGWLYVAGLSAAEPVDLTTPWLTVDATWRQPGYTEEGHSDTYSPSFDPIEVAEERLPVDYEQSSAEQNIEFSLAEVTALNISLAFNGGTITTSGSGASQIDTFEPNDIGTDPTEWKIGWESFDGRERKVWRRCLQVGDVEQARRKAPDKALIPLTFKLLKPLTGAKPFKHIIARPV